MKVLILAGLLMLISTAYAQESLHCIPLSESRVIHELALKGIALDSMLDNRNGKIVILQNAIASQAESYEREIGHEREKVKIQKELVRHQSNVSQSFHDQSEHYRKKVRRVKWQRNGLAVLLVVVIGLSL